MFYYQPEKNKAEVAKGKELTNHMIALVFPEMTNSSKVQIMDSNCYDTDPDFEKSEFHYNTDDTVSHNQEGIVDGLFFVRDRNLTKVAKAAERKKRADVV